MLIYFPRLILGVLTKVSLIQNLNAKKKGGGGGKWLSANEKSYYSGTKHYIAITSTECQIDLKPGPQKTQHCNMCQFWGWGYSRANFIFLEAHASLVLKRKIILKLKTVPKNYNTVAVGGDTLTPHNSTVS